MTDLIQKVYQHSVYEAAKVITEINPLALFYENANGRTPLEISRSIYLKDVSSKQFTVNRNIAQNCGGNMAYDKNISAFPDTELAEREKSEKAKRIESGEEEETASSNENKKTYKYALEVVEGLKAKEVPIKRKLVSLADANSLARRLASKETDLDEERARNRRYGYSSSGQTDLGYGIDHSSTLR